MLADILKIHVISGAVMSGDLTDGMVVPTLNGDITVGVGEDGVTFSTSEGTATVIEADIETSNGVIHIINEVIIPPSDDEESDIIQTATDNGSFTTLVAAVEAAGLAETLSGEGPFTVLAPNDGAFDNLPEGLVAELLEEAAAGGTRLAEILKVHVISGAVMSGDLTDGMVVPTLNGDITVGVSEDGVTFSTSEGTATVIEADIETSNGVIHIINEVLLPSAAPEGKNIVETAMSTEGFSTLVTAVGLAGFADLLSGEGPFTVLAPTDDAFNDLEDGTLDMLIMDAEAGGSMLADILNVHVIVGLAVMSGDLTDGMTVTTANGDLTVSVNGADVSFSSAGGSVANVVIPNVEATNGVIHAIDMVLMP